MHAYRFSWIFDRQTIEHPSGRRLKLEITKAEKLLNEEIFSKAHSQQRSGVQSLSRG